MAIRTNNNKLYYIAAEALHFSENVGGDARRILVSMVAGSIVRIFSRDVTFFNTSATGTYKTWRMRAYNTYLGETNFSHISNGNKLYLYLRIVEDDVYADLIFSRQAPTDYTLEGVNETDVPAEGEEDDVVERIVHYVHIGTLSLADGKSIITWDSGNLGTDQYTEDNAGGEMFKIEIEESEKFISPLLKFLFAEFKHYITLAGTKVSKILTAKDVTDPTNARDEHLTTSGWVWELISKHLLRKDIGGTQDVNSALNIKGGVKTSKLDVDCDKEKATGAVVAKIGPSSDSMFSGSGTIITDDGRLQTNTLEVRGSLKVLDLVASQIHSLDGYYYFSDAHKIAEVWSADGSNGVFTLVFEKEHEKDFLKFYINDILLSIKTDLDALNDADRGQDEAGNTIPMHVEKTCWCRVIATNEESEEGITDSGDVYIPNEDEGKLYAVVQLYDGSEEPEAGAYIARRGNTSGGVRASSWCISVNEGRITYYINQTSDKMSATNYGLTVGKLPDIPAVNALGRGGDIGVYAQTVIAENLYQAKWNGSYKIITIDEGAWREGKHYVHKSETKNGETIQTQSRVTHNGSSWDCLVDGTTLEPGKDYSDWARVVGELKVEKVETFYAISETDVLEEGGLTPDVEWVDMQIKLINPRHDAPQYFYGPYFPYMWSKTITTYEDSSQVETEAAHIIGVWGETGEVVTGNVDDSLFAIGVGNDGVLQTESAIVFETKARLLKGNVPIAISTDGGHRCELLTTLPEHMNVELTPDGTELKIKITLTDGVDFNETPSHVLKIRVYGKVGVEYYTRIVTIEVNGSHLSKDGESAVGLHLSTQTLTFPIGKGLIEKYATSRSVTADVFFGTNKADTTITNASINETEGLSVGYSGNVVTIIPTAGKEWNEDRTLTITAKGEYQGNAIELTGVVNIVGSENGETVRGPQGTSITSMKEQYARTMKVDEQIQEEAWQEANIEPTPEYPYVWNREVVTFYDPSTDKEEQRKTEAHIYREFSDGLVSHTNKYAVSNSAAVPEDASFVYDSSDDATSQMNEEEHRFLWNWEMIVYKDTSKNISNKRLVCVWGEKGESTTTFWIDTNTLIVKVAGGICTPGTITAQLMCSRAEEEPKVYDGEDYKLFYAIYNNGQMTRSGERELPANGLTSLSTNTSITYKIFAKRRNGNEWSGMYFARDIALYRDGDKGTDSITLQLSASSIVFPTLDGNISQGAIERSVEANIYVGSKVQTTYIDMSQTSLSDTNGIRLWQKYDDDKNVVCLTPQSQAFWNKDRTLKITAYAFVEGQQVYMSGEVNVVGSAQGQTVQGPQGASVVGFAEEFAASQVPNPNFNELSWETSHIEPTRELPYVWNREVITFDDPLSGRTTQTTDPHLCCEFSDGIVEHYNEYAVTTTENEPSNFPYKTPSEALGYMDAVTNRYLWNKETIEYKDGVKKENVRLVCVWGMPGENVVTASVSSQNLFVSTDDNGVVQAKTERTFDVMMFNGTKPVNVTSAEFVDKPAFDNRTEGAVLDSTSIRRVTFSIPADYTFSDAETYKIKATDIEGNVRYVSVSVIPNRQGKQGRPGDTTTAMGYPGCVVRTFDTFESGATYRNDTRLDHDGNIHFLDYICLVNPSSTEGDGTSGYLIFECQKTFVCNDTMVNGLKSRATAEAIIAFMESLKSDDVQLLKNISADLSHFFTNLVAKNANIKMLSGSCYVVVDDEGNIVAGMGNKQDGYIWAGGKTPSEAKFRVTKEGYLYAETGTFEGDVSSKFKDIRNVYEDLYGERVIYNLDLTQTKLIVNPRYEQNLHVVLPTNASHVGKTVMLYNERIIGSSNYTAGRVCVEIMGGDTFIGMSGLDADYARAADTSKILYFYRGMITLLAVPGDKDHCKWMLTSIQCAGFTSDSFLFGQSYAPKLLWRGRVNGLSYVLPSFNISGLSLDKFTFRDNGQYVLSYYYEKGNVDMISVAENISARISVINQVQVFVEEILIDRGRLVILITVKTLAGALTNNGIFFLELYYTPNNYGGGSIQLTQQ